ncbi:hypothetical protein shim_08110 [Shimia sp. SK013]|uniref:hypothetical protein n=1 Tax=Shimia sp. SK013 TaxID=1389006 RepID=UPI0006CC1D5A|nr:hypothetical protein [Shimia sp. SK013]KPA22526.1 hypothetical protein shim_08110 [Shimia sp. SK013]
MSKARFGVWVVLLSVVTGAAGAEEELGTIAELEIWWHQRLAEARSEDGAMLAAFTTDGCSGGMSSVWRAIAQTFPDFRDTQGETPPWESCCVEHDVAYHIGGADVSPKAGYFARLSADETLRQCVQEVAQSEGAALQLLYGQSQETIETAFEFISNRMFDAVRVGGAPCSGLPWRWGYGWPQCW